MKSILITLLQRNCIKKILIVLLFTFLITGCSDYLDVESTHVASEDKQWESLTDTRSALMGVYGLFRAAAANENAHWVYGELRKGDFKSSNRTDIKAVINNDLNSSYNMLHDLSDWRRFYAVINAASVFIENAPRVNEEDERYSDSNLELDIAQARALRAFAYFYMSRIWGDVPLITSSFDNGSFDEKPRTDQQQVLNFAENELLEAANTLPYIYGGGEAQYYGEGQEFWSGVLINKISAYAILAHLSAWKGNYIDADVYSEFIMNNYEQANIGRSSTAELSSSTGLFAGRSSDHIVAFNFMDSNGESTTTGHIEDLTLAEPFTARPVPDIYVPKDYINEIFDHGYDHRFGIDTVSQTHTTNYFTNFNGEFPVFSKIKVQSDGQTEGSYALYGSTLIFTRLEEIILLRAEILAVLSRQEEAVSELNSIRNERGLPSFVIGESGDLLDAVFEERRRELLGEGWRWYDQIRHQRLKKNDSEMVELIEEDGIYWPISSKVLRNNSLINQNDYWQ